jgi:CRISPR-associated protein Cas2
MRRAYIVTYDVSDPRRLRKVFQTLRGYGDHLQLSVFRCELVPAERVVLETKLRDAIHHGEDQVLFIDLGVADGRATGSIRSLGRACPPPERTAIIV